MIRILDWDWKEQPDFDEIGRILAELTDHKIWLRTPETGSDQLALVLANEPLDDAVAYEAYQAHQRRWDDE